MSGLCRDCSNGGSSTVTPIDLNDWSVHLYPEIKNDCPGSTFGANWFVQDASGRRGDTVIQTLNGQQTMFCSPFNIFDPFFSDFDDGVTFTGQIKVEEPPTGETRDDDYFGFALGFNPGDELPDAADSRGADFILVDWKRDSQLYSNSCREDEPGEDDNCLRFPGYDPRGSNQPVEQCDPVRCQDVAGLPSDWNEATEGLAASQVLGLAHADLFWSHFSCPATDRSNEGDFSTGFIEELTRGETRGNTGWNYEQDRNKEWYDFRFDISRTRIRVYVDNCEVPEMTIRAEDLISRNRFNDGKFCFYNYSQENVRYKGFALEERCDPENARPPSPTPPPPPPAGKGKGKGKGSGSSSKKSSSGKGKGGKGKGGSSKSGSKSGSSNKSGGIASMKCDCDTNTGVRLMTFHHHLGSMYQEGATIHFLDGETMNPFTPTNWKTEKMKFQPEVSFDVKLGEYHGSILLCIDEAGQGKYWRFETSCRDKDLAGMNSHGMFESGSNGVAYGSHYPVKVTQWSDSSEVICDSSIALSTAASFTQSECVSLQNKIRGSQCDINSRIADNLYLDSMKLRNLIRITGMDVDGKGPSVKLSNGFSMWKNNDTCSSVEDDEWAIAYQATQSNAETKYEQSVKELGKEAGKAEKILCRDDYAEVLVWGVKGTEIQESSYFGEDQHCFVKFRIPCGGGKDYEPSKDEVKIETNYDSERDYCKPWVGFNEWTSFIAGGFKDMIDEIGKVKIPKDDQPNWRYIEKLKLTKQFNSNSDNWSFAVKWLKGDKPKSDFYMAKCDKESKECGKEYEEIKDLSCDSEGYATLHVWSHQGNDKLKEWNDGSDDDCKDYDNREKLGDEWYKDLCHLEVKIKCDNRCYDDRRRLDESFAAYPPEPPILDQEKAASICKHDLQEDDVRPMVVDKCSAEASGGSPVTVFSKDGHTVTFTLSQVWKDCDSSARHAVDWIAADYVSTSGNLECHRMDDVGCGDFSMRTAQCSDGVAVIDLYVSDSSDENPFRQADGSSLIVPEACYPDGDGRDACHFRYMIDCAPRCEDVEMPLKAAAARKTWSASVRDAFSSGLFGTGSRK
mmetsp:Transcript_7810/g.16289  ORF Transcript_7810/g.16289 Transcript_7810/m.16289 type:complete len:1072 (+) Transcript_7810:106-3321(+)